MFERWQVSLPRCVFVCSFQMTCAAALCCCHSLPFFFPVAVKVLFPQIKRLPDSYSNFTLCRQLRFDEFPKNTVMIFFSLCAAGRLPPGQTVSGIRSKCSRFREVLEVLRRVLMVFCRLFCDSFVSKGDWMAVSRPRRRKVLRVFKGKHANCRVFTRAGWLQGLGKWPASP